MATFFHTGDIGDIIACLPTIREFGGGELVIGYKPGGHYGRESMQGARYEALRPLLEAQGLWVRWGDYEPGMIDFSTFRVETTERRGENLALWQARHIGVVISLDPWLEADKDKRTSGKTVFARSTRYRNPEFKWPWIVQTNPDAVFIGFINEHEEFVASFGPIERIATGNLLDVAMLIAGADLTVCNQSSPFWIAIGLGAPVIQETHNDHPNSILHLPSASYPCASAENMLLSKKRSACIHEPFRLTS